jgi:hypothetical protein
MKTELPDMKNTVARGMKISAALMTLGGAGAAIGLATDPRQLGFSYLLAFMFFLSLSLGGLFLVMIHHLFDAGWSVPVRRMAEHLAFLSVALALLFLPLALLAPHIYPWMERVQGGGIPDFNAVYLDAPLFPARAAVYFAVWVLLAWRLRHWSLKQDVTGAAECTFRMRKLAAAGIFLFGITLTLAAVDWMKSLQPQWYSTMFGVYYFASSVGPAVAALYLLAAKLRGAGPLRELFQPRCLHDLGELLLAFTIFYAYIHFSQYLIIWNANLLEETFWYALREQGWWWNSGLLLVFGRFLLPFLLLLRIDAKLKLKLMVPLCIWVCLMHFVEVSYNVLPPLHLEEFPWRWTDAACVAFIGGTLGCVFLKSLARHPLYPLKDPRLKEALVIHEPPEDIAEVAREGRVKT